MKLLLLHEGTGLEKLRGGGGGVCQRHNTEGFAGEEGGERFQWLKSSLLCHLQWLI